MMPSSKCLSEPLCLSHGPRLLLRSPFPSTWNWSCGLFRSHGHLVRQVDSVIVGVGILLPLSMLMFGEVDKDLEEGRRGETVWEKKPNEEQMVFSPHVMPLNCIVVASESDGESDAVVKNTIEKGFSSVDMEEIYLCLCISVFGSLCHIGFSV